MTPSRFFHFLLLLPICAAGALRAQGPNIGNPPTAPPIDAARVSRFDQIAPQTTSAWYNISSRATVRDNWNSIFAPTSAVPTGWAGDVLANIPGTTTPAFKDAVATRINWFRAMAGVPVGITIDATFSAKDQQAALMFSANRQLSHTPPSTWTDYTPEAAEAAGNSNICYGFTADPGCLMAYVIDSGSNNPEVGHRRWVLYPQTQKMGTGDVPQSGPANTYPPANALWVLDGNYGTARPGTRDTYVAWPPPGYVPYQSVGPRWSFSYPEADFATAKVSMQRNGAAVPVFQELVGNGFGENTIVWIPDNLDASSYTQPSPPASDTTSVVTVSNVVIGGVPQSFTYPVTVFDPATIGVVPPPVPSTVTPAWGTALVQPFTFSFTDQRGWQDLGVVNILINNFLDGRHACYLAYAQSTNLLLLVNDAGDAGGPYIGQMALDGSAGTIENTQCRISGLGSSRSGSGNTLTLALNVTFKSGLAGNRIVYMAARDQAQNNSGWQAYGAWQVPGGASGAIAAVSASPSRGTGTGQQQYTFTIADTQGAADIGIVDVLMNDFIDGRRACYLAYIAQSKLLVLVNDAGDAGGPFAGSLALGNGGTIGNGQCTVGLVSAAVNGTALTLTLNISPTAGFTGNRILFVAARDALNGNNTDWQALGTWAVQ